MLHFNNKKKRSLIYIVPTTTRGDGLQCIYKHIFLLHGQKGYFITFLTSQGNLIICKSANKIFKEFIYYHLNK